MASPRSSHGISSSGYRLEAKSCLSEWQRSAIAPPSHGRPFRSPAAAISNFDARFFLTFAMGQAGLSIVATAPWSFILVSTRTPTPSDSMHLKSETVARGPPVAGITDEAQGGDKIHPAACMSPASMKPPDCRCHSAA